MTEVVEVNSLAEVLADLEKRGIQGVQRYKAVNGYISMKARYSDTPVSGTFELTPLCNLDCKMCYVHLQANQLKPDERILRADEWKSIIKQAVDAGMIFADLTGGECLTHPDFKEIYKYLFSLGIHPGILTNGRLLTEDMVAFLTEYPPAVLQITLYGSCEEAYERVCGHRAFSEVMNGIERVKKAELPLYISIMPSRFMQDDIPYLLNLVHSLSVPYAIGSVIIPARPETGREFEQFTIEMDAMSKINCEESQYLLTLDRESKIKAVPHYIPQKASPLRGLPCGGGHSSFHVNWKGEMCPCIAFSATVHYSILKDTFISSWDEVRRELQNYKEPDQCRNCQYKHYCVSCPGEKTNCVSGGKVNTFVCMKLQRLVNEGMIQVGNRQEC